MQHRDLSLKLVALAAAMFLFGFALVPLYDVFCDITGLGGRTESTAAAVVERVDVDREVRIEFVASLERGAPWRFAPAVSSMRVHPGQIYTAYFRAENLRDAALTGQAVPSVAPGLAAKHLRKIECFCFTQQDFGPLEARDMPVVFMIEPELPEHIDTLTLSYTFFALPNVESSAAAEGPAVTHDSAAAHGDAHGAQGATPAHASAGTTAPAAASADTSKD